MKAGKVYKKSQKFSKENSRLPLTHFEELRVWVVFEYKHEWICYNKKAHTRSLRYVKKNNRKSTDVLLSN